MIATDTKTQFEQSLFLVKQQINSDFPESPIKTAVSGILQNVIDSYSATQSRIVWEIEEVGDVDGNTGIMATLLNNGRQHRIGFRYGQDERPALFIWSVLDFVAEKPVNHQIVIPLTEHATLRDGNAEMQYWMSLNALSPSKLIAQACFGLGNLKNISTISPTLDTTTLDSIPLDLFKITL